MNQPSVSIEAVAWASHSAQLLAVRFQVFVCEQGVPPELERDSADDSALHLLATLADGHAIGTARMLGDGHIGRMAVLADWRGRGIGSALLRALLDEAHRCGYPSVFLNAQLGAVPFYQRHGFVPVGPLFVDAGIEHRRMERDTGPGTR